MKAEIGATVALDAANDVMVFPLWCWWFGSMSPTLVTTMAALNPTMTIFDADMGISSFSCGEDPVYIMWYQVRESLVWSAREGPTEDQSLGGAEGYPVLSLRRLPLA
jgi:hypothetical protein